MNIINIISKRKYYRKILNTPHYFLSGSVDMGSDKKDSTLLEKKMAAGGKKEKKKLITSLRKHTKIPF